MRIVVGSLCVIVFVVTLGWLAYFGYATPRTSNLIQVGSLAMSDGTVLAMENGHLTSAGAGSYAVESPIVRTIERGLWLTSAAVMLGAGILLLRKPK